MPAGQPAWVANVETAIAALFEWDVRPFGKKRLDERSGFGIRYSPACGRASDARFSHRDGIEAALSMRAHPYFRVVAWVRTPIRPIMIEEACSAVPRRSTMMDRNPRQQ